MMAIEPLVLGDDKGVHDVLGNALERDDRPSLEPHLADESAVGGVEAGRLGRLVLGELLDARAGLGRAEEPGPENGKRQHADQGEAGEHEAATNQERADLGIHQSKLAE
jgi:hypothetical protein